MTVRRVEIQRAGDVVEVAERKELDTELTLMSMKGDERRESHGDRRSSSATVMI
jgi:hypothetical protein